MIKRVLSWAFLLMLIFQYGCRVELKNRGKFYVSSEKGSDTNKGTFRKPFKSIQHAVSLLQPGDTCYIMEGIYREEVKLANMNGTKDLPVVLTSFPGDRVILDGTMDISSSWIPHEGGVYKTILERDIWQLFVEGQMMTSARWPNAEAWSEDMWDLEGKWIHQSMDGSYGHFVDDGTLDLAGSGFDFTGAIAVMNVGSWETFAGKVLEHSSGRPDFFYEKTFPESNFRKAWEGRAFFECSMECLDNPGEWFYENESRTLYLYPMEGENPGGKKIRGKVRTYSLDVEHCSYLEVRDIVFFATTGRFLECDHLLLVNCEFSFPSYSRRMLGSTDKPEATKVYSSNERPTENRIINCSFEYADGSGLMIGGFGDLIENCSFYSIDYGCVGTVNDVFINARDARGLTFRRNTMSKTGNSVGLKSGQGSLVEMNFATRLGLLQHDGSALQASTENVEGTVMRFNWVFNSAKSGIRFDSPWLIPEVYGIRGTINYNVVWNTRRIQPKGDQHLVYHNTSFDNEQSDLSIFAVLERGGVNKQTITRNNAINVLSGSNSGPHIPIPGIYDHNWVGMEMHKDVKQELRDPANFDFRPRVGSHLIDAGVVIEGVNEGYSGNAPDIGAYEYGSDSYWIPGRKEQKASFPIPNNDAKKMPLDRDLIYLNGYKSTSADIYFGTDSTAVANAGFHDPEFLVSKPNPINVVDPSEYGKLLKPDTRYYWRVDAVRERSTEKGNIWTFTTGTS